MRTTFRTAFPTGAGWLRFGALLLLPLATMGCGGPRGGAGNGAGGGGGGGISGRPEAAHTVDAVRVAAVGAAVPPAAAFVYSAAKGDAPDGLMQATAERLRDSASTDWRTYFPSADDLRRRAAYVLKHGDNLAGEPQGAWTVEHPAEAETAARAEYEQQIDFMRGILADEAVDLGGSQVYGVLNGEPWRARLNAVAWVAPAAPVVVEQPETDDADNADLTFQQGRRVVLLGRLRASYPVASFDRGVEDGGTIGCSAVPELRGWVTYGSDAALAAATGPEKSVANLTFKELEAAAQARKAVSTVECVFVFRRRAARVGLQDAAAMYLVKAEFQVTGPPPSPTALLRWFGMPNPWLDADFQDAEAAGKTLSFQKVTALCRSRVAPPVSAVEAEAGGHAGGAAGARPWSEERSRQCQRFGQMSLVKMTVRLVEMRGVEAPKKPAEK